MDWAGIHPAAERDEKFRRELLAAAHSGLRLIGLLALTVPLLLKLARLPVPLAGLAALGVAALAVAQARWSRERGRLLASIGVCGMAAVLAWHAPEPPLSACLAALLLSSVTLVPWRPPEALALGVAISLLAAVTGRAGWPGGYLFLGGMAALAAALAAILYSRRLAAFRRREAGRHADEYLALAQTRVLLLENAASLSHLAATLAHELNSPLGALASAAGTLAAVSGRRAVAAPEEQPRLASIEADLQRSIRSSLERLHQIIERIQRIAALDDAELQQVDLNALLQEVAALVATQAGQQLALEFDLGTLPPLTCQPQQLSAVFSNVLTNAAHATGGRGPVSIVTRYEGGRIEIRIRDAGHGIAEEDLANIFEPGFKASDGRMATGNWSLFSCRQIVHGHGGEMYMTSAEGKGSTVFITLPV